MGHFFFRHEDHYRLSLSSAIGSGFGAGFCGRISFLGTSVNLTSTNSYSYLYYQIQGNAAELIPVRLLCTGDFLALYDLEYSGNSAPLVYPEKSTGYYYFTFKLLVNYYHFSSSFSLNGIEEMFLRAYLSEDLFLQLEADTVVMNDLTAWSADTGRLYWLVLLIIKYYVI